MRVTRELAQLEIEVGRARRTSASAIPTRGTDNTARRPERERRALTILIICGSVLMTRKPLFVRAFSDDPPARIRLSIGSLRRVHSHSCIYYNSAFLLRLIYLGENHFCSKRIGLLVFSRRDWCSFRKNGFFFFPQSDKKRTLQ